LEGVILRCTCDSALTVKLTFKPIAKEKERRGIKARKAMYTSVLGVHASPPLPFYLTDACAYKTSEAFGITISDIIVLFPIKRKETKW
jgi:hypothetical protein